MEEDRCLNSMAFISQTEFKTCPDANVILLIEMHSRIQSQWMTMTEDYEGWGCDGQSMQLEFSFQLDHRLHVWQGQMNLNVVKSYEQIVFMGNSILITAWLSLEKYFSTKICCISLSRILRYYYARVLQVLCGSLGFGIWDTEPDSKEGWEGDQDNVSECALTAQKLMSCLIITWFNGSWIWL